MTEAILDLWYFWLFVPVVLIYLLYRVKVKDNIDEKTISVLLRELDSTKYKVIDNQILRIDGTIPRIGKVFQIDHIVISNYGVFIVETNNYKRWALGDDFVHTQALRQSLAEYQLINIIPIIVFPDNVAIKEKTNTKVVHSVNLLKTIKEYTVETITNQEKHSIYSKLVNLNTEMFVNGRLIK
ncbi:nuclease-related domain-containing protein [Desulfosporosinus sp. BG]|uniref:nuclease-related domain-containing protein n=1 Tax=Desulfosporosinus sp. BG TaxID=1633135 RepID=UPI00083B7340|nr:nuclease-related domain-containing protein [Desulfosporosinus sp. BG]ODA39988.1 Nuclease-related domain protein [Desulfosporosinus sp. BG]